MNRVLCVLLLFPVLSTALQTGELPFFGEVPEDVEWKTREGNDLWMGAEEQQSIGPLQSFGVCSANLGMHCLKYHVNSTTLIESFVVNKIQYEDVQAGDRSEYEYVDGSHCLSSNCDRKLRLHFKQWCLVMINTDPLFRTAEVKYSYHACMSENDKDHAIIVLAIALIVLLVAVSVCCLCCCRSMKRKVVYQLHPTAYTSIPPDAQSAGLGYIPPSSQPPMVPFSDYK